MARFWKKDWFSALAISVAFLLLGNSLFIEKLELSSYDFAMDRMAREPDKKVAIVAIDDRSIENLGRWPLATLVTPVFIFLETTG